MYKTDTLHCGQLLVDIIENCLTAEIFNLKAKYVLIVNSYLNSSSKWYFLTIIHLCPKNSFSFNDHFFLEKLPVSC